MSERIQTKILMAVYTAAIIVLALDLLYWRP